MESSIGLFDSGTEYSLLQNGKLEFHHSRDETSPGDVAYFALHALSLAQISPDQLRRIVYYGTNGSKDTVSGLERIFRSPIHALNPMSVVDLNTDRFDEGFQFESFAVCLGAAL